jgi:acyl-CoA thioesterase-2
MRAFGGQVASQALAAAGAEVDPAQRPTSLHAYFVRAGDTTRPITYSAEAVDEGPTSSIRRVTATQSGKAILTLEASFRGPDADEPTWPESPEPVSMPDLEQAADDVSRWAPAGSPAAQWLEEQSKRMRFELRFAGIPAFLAGHNGRALRGQRFWLRTLDPLLDAPLQHACALTYVSDLYLVSTALAKHGIGRRRTGVAAASLDHTVWFHRPFRVDEWVLYEQRSPTSAGGRGLSAGRILNQAGEVIATVRQEVLLRVSGS